MYVARVPNRGSSPTVLLRESYREAGKVRNRTLANLSAWPEAKVDALSRVLKGQQPAAAVQGTFEITRSLAHGHVAAVLGTARQLGLEELIDPVPSRQRDLVTAMAVAQVTAPDSPLAMARGLREQNTVSSLGQVLGLGGCAEGDLYAAMDWLAARQDRIEDALASRHLAGGTLVRYDISAAAFEGRRSPIGTIGHPKAGEGGRVQIACGLLTSKEGIPVAIEVSAGSTGEPAIVAAQLSKVTDRFGTARVVLVGDRGMLTAARLRQDAGPAQLDWITALRAPQVKALVRDGALRPSLFDAADLAEITHPDYPGERLVAWKNPLLEAERARKREALLAATESGLDGICVLRTSVAGEHLDGGEAVASYTAVAQAERAFRAVNTDLDIWPVRRTEDRVHAHVFLRMLSYYVTWHLRARLAPLLFDDEPAAEAARPGPAAPATGSPRALARPGARHAHGGPPGHSLSSLLADLATICLNQIQPADPALPAFRLVTTPTPLQRHALDLLDISHRLGTA